MADIVNNYLVEFRKDLVKRQANGINWSGYVEDSYLIDCDCPRFGSGEAKGKINESVRGVDLFILVDVCNYSITYKVCGYENHMSPDDHYQDLKRVIAAATGKAHRINVIMPFLYEGPSAQAFQEGVSGLCSGAGRADEYGSFQYYHLRRS